MLKTLLAALLVAALALSLVPVPTTAQNIGTGGRFASDAGNPVYGYGTKTDTSTQSMAAAPGAGVASYVYWAHCASTSATVAVAILKSGSTAVAAIACPPSGGFSQPVYFNPPLRLAANAAFTMEASTSITTAYFTSMVRTSRFQ